MALLKFAAVLLLVFLVAAVGGDAAEVPGCMKSCMPVCLEFGWTTENQCVDACKVACKPEPPSRGLHEVNRRAA